MDHHGPPVGAVPSVPAAVSPWPSASPGAFTPRGEGLPSRTSDPEGELDLPEGWDGWGRTVVIGAGVAGLAAAGGLEGEVVLLESAAEPGGRARWAGGYMLFVDTPELAAEGFDFTVGELLGDWELLTGAPPAAATERYLEESGEVRDELAALGLGFALGHQDPIVRRYLDHNPEGGGPALVSALVADLPPGVELRLGTPALGLRVERGRVLGVELEDEDLDAERVIVAAGGFVNRADLVARWARLPAGTWGIGTDDGARGDSLGLVEPLQVGLTAMETIGWNANLIGVAGADGRPMTCARAPWIWVDREARRFVDEGAGWSMSLAAALDAHPGTVAVAAWDTLAGCVTAADLPFLEAAREEGSALRCAEDPSSLAARLELPPVELARTLAQVEAHRSGAPDPFARSVAFPELEGTLCGFAPGRLAAKNYGGLATDLEGRVLDRWGRPIPGLYAAGEAAGMGTPGLGGAFGFDGSLGAVVWSGMRVADTVQRDAGQGW